MDLEKGADLHLDASMIPKSLHALIPLIERWGFESQSDQDDFVLLVKAENPTELLDFNQKLDAARDLIRDWGMSLGEFRRNVSEISEEAWQHPYWSFLAALKVREITGPNTQSQDQSVAAKSMAADIEAYEFTEATRLAEDLFRAKKFQEFIDTISTYEHLLTNANLKKLNYARKKAQKTDQ